MNPMTAAEFNDGIHWSKEDHARIALALRRGEESLAVVAELLATATFDSSRSIDTLTRAERLMSPLGDRIVGISETQAAKLEDYTMDRCHKDGWLAFELGKLYYDDCPPYRDPEMDNWWRKGWIHSAEEWRRTTSDHDYKTPDYLRAMEPMTTPPIPTGLPPEYAEDWQSATSGEELESCDAARWRAALSEIAAINMQVVVNAKSHESERDQLQADLTAERLTRNRVQAERDKALDDCLDFKDTINEYAALLRERMEKCPCKFVVQPNGEERCDLCRKTEAALEGRK